MRKQVFYDISVLLWSINQYSLSCVFHILFLFGFICLFVYVKGKSVEREAEAGGEIFHLLAHMPNGHNNQGWAKLKLGVSSFIPASLMDTGAQAFGLPVAAFPRLLRGSRMGNRAAKTQIGTCLGCQFCRQYQSGASQCQLQLLSPSSYLFFLSSSMPQLSIPV